MAIPAQIAEIAEKNGSEVHDGDNFSVGWQGTPGKPEVTLVLDNGNHVITFTDRDSLQQLGQAVRGALDYLLFAYEKEHNNAADSQKR